MTHCAKYQLNYYVKTLVDRKLHNIHGKIIKECIKRNLIPFNLGIGYNTQTNKKELIMPQSWISATLENYKKHINKISLTSSSLKKDFFACLVSTNEDFIDWFKLRMGDFENLNENINKGNYKLNGIQLIVNLSDKDKNLLKFDKEKIHPELINNKFSQFINNSSII